MWIFLGILAVLLAILTAVALLPIHLIFKTDENGALQFRCKILFKTLSGKSAATDNAFTNKIKQLLGLDRFKKAGTVESSKPGTISDNIATLTGLVTRIKELVRFCTVRILHLDIICAQADAAETAIRYGTCYAIVSPLLALLHSFTRVRKKGERINITPDFISETETYHFEMVLSVRVFRLALAFLRAARDESQRRKQPQ